VNTRDSVSPRLDVIELKNEMEEVHHVQTNIISVSHVISVMIIDTTEIVSTAY